MSQTAPKNCPRIRSDVWESTSQPTVPHWQTDTNNGLLELACQQVYRSPSVPGNAPTPEPREHYFGGGRPLRPLGHATFLLSFRWLPLFFLLFHLERASKDGAGTRASHMSAVCRGVFFYAQETFLRSCETFCRVPGFAAFVTQRRPVLALTASSLVAEFEASEAPRDHHPTSYPTAPHANLEAR